MRILVLCLSIVFSGCANVQKTAQPQNLEEKQLKELVKSSDKLEVKSPRYDESLAVFETQDKREITQFIDGIYIKDRDRKGSLLCEGDVVINFYQGATKIATLNYASSNILQWREWRNDEWLTDESEKFLIHWLNERGINLPLYKYNSKSKK